MAAEGSKGQARKRAAPGNKILKISSPGRGDRIPVDRHCWVNAFAPLQGAFNFSGSFPGAARYALAPGYHLSRLRRFAALRGSSYCVASASKIGFQCRLSRMCWTWH